MRDVKEIELRFVWRSQRVSENINQKIQILQYRTTIVNELDNYYQQGRWTDVPLVEEKDE